MKKLLLVVISLLSFSVSSMELAIEPHIAAGIRGGDESLNDGVAGYVSGKLSFIKQEVDNFNELNFMALGVNYQSDGKFALAVSPLSFSSLSGLTIGVDYILKEDDVKGGNYGLFIGMKFK